MSAGAYSISAPVDFVNSAANDNINLYASLDLSGAQQNLVTNFVTNKPGDMLYRDVSGSLNKLAPLSIGSAGQVLTVAGTSASQIQQVDTVADVSLSLNGTYFILHSPSFQFYVWLTDGTATDPATAIPVPADLVTGSQIKHGISVTFSSGDSANTIATNIRAALNASPFGSYFTASGATNAVIITQDYPGYTEPAAEGLTATGFTFNAPSVVGSSLIPTWVTPATNSATTFRASTTDVSGSNTGVPASSSWTTLSNTYVVWDTATAPNHDSGTMFNTTSGVATIPSSGTYEISAGVSFIGNNTGNGLITGRKNIRQMRIRNTTSGVTVDFDESQSQANANNPTVLVTSGNAKFNSGDTLVLQVRHDATSALKILADEGNSVVGPSTYFCLSKTS